MKIPGWLILLSLLPLKLFAQEFPSDTISLPDTITDINHFAKNAGEYTIENRVDTAITLVINEIMARNSGFIVDSLGEDDDWFEIYNYGTEPLRIDNLFFSDDPGMPMKWSPAPTEELFLEPKQYYIFWADGQTEQGINHASFKLSGDGEFLAINDRQGNPIDQIGFPEQTANISYGRYPDAGLEWNYFPEPSPGEANAIPGGTTVLPLPVSSHQGGFYSGPLHLSLEARVEGASIHFTNDCSIPDKWSRPYIDEIYIDSSCIIRARLIKDNAVDGPVLSLSFFMHEESYDQNVLSIVAEPGAFFGTTGLITTSRSNLEIDAQAEFIKDGQAVYNMGCGVQLHKPKRTPYSLRLYSRSRYGNNWFEYPFFNEAAPERFKRLVLRNGGNDLLNKDPGNTHFRDPLIHLIAQHANPDALISASTPASLYLNGSYVGMFNLRERIDEYYIENHCGISENYDLIEREFNYDNNLNVIKGDLEAWTEMRALADQSGNTMSDEVFEDLSELVDLENFTHYWMTEVFAGNFDWLSNNVKLWKPESGPWQWIFWDTDHGLGLKYHNYGLPEWNTLSWSLGFNNRSWEDGYNNLLIRNLMKNTKFRESFIIRFAQLLQADFSYRQTKPLLDSMITLYENDLARHAAHWEKPIVKWTDACSNVDQYLQKRPGEVMSHIRQHFLLEEPVPVRIRVEPPGAGELSLSGLSTNGKEIRNMCFPGLHYQVSNKQAPGFNLIRCSPFPEVQEEYEFVLTDSMDMVAYYAPVNQALPIQINEVFSNNREEFDTGDWVEFYYYGSEAIDLSGHSLLSSDQSVLFSFKDESVILPGQSFIIGGDRESFFHIFPGNIQFFGPLAQEINEDGGLRIESLNGDTLCLFEIKDDAGWPAPPEEGFSFELKSITDNASLGKSWGLSETIFGSPGIHNDYIYGFRSPEGRDAEFLSSENHSIDLEKVFYSDPDGHTLAQIRIHDISGPGIFHLGGTSLVQAGTYTPGILSFEAQEPYYKNSLLQYSFVDSSGHESLKYSIRFSANTALSGYMEEAPVLYPNPAKQQCKIRFPAPQSGSMYFFLFDMNGKQLISQQRDVVDDEIHIDLPDLAHGMYFYLIRQEDKSWKGKLGISPD